MNQASRPPRLSLSFLRTCLLCLFCAAGPGLLMAQDASENSTAEASQAEVKPTDDAANQAAASAAASAADSAAKEAAPKEDAAATDAAKPSGKDKDKKKWRPLFDGKKLGAWKVTRFGGEGPVDVKDGTIQLDYGQYMTGITHSGKGLPRVNYEIELEAMRVDGMDFFCGLTFPVAKKHATLVVGGWGGSIVGISSIDDMDASENETTVYRPFKNKRWYKIRLRVTKEKLSAWIDDKEMVDVEIKDRRLSTRIEVDLSKPLGIACFDTQAALRNLRIRRLEKDKK